MFQERENSVAALRGLVALYCGHSAKWWWLSTVPRHGQFVEDVKPAAHKRGAVKTLPESVCQMELRTCFYVRVFKALRAATADVLDPSGHKSKSAALMLATQKDTFLDPLGKWVRHVVNGVRKIAKKDSHSCQRDPQKNSPYPEPTVCNHMAITGSCDFCWTKLVGRLLTLTNLRLLTDFNTVFSIKF